MKKAIFTLFIFGFFCNLLSASIINSSDDSNEYIPSGKPPFIYALFGSYQPLGEINNSESFGHSFSVSGQIYKSGIVVTYQYMRLNTPTLSESLKKIAYENGDIRKSNSIQIAKKIFPFKTDEYLYFNPNIGIGYLGYNKLEDVVVVGYTSGFYSKRRYNLFYQYKGVFQASIGLDLNLNLGRYVGLSVGVANYYSEFKTAKVVKFGLNLGLVRAFWKDDSYYSRKSFPRY